MANAPILQVCHAAGGRIGAQPEGVLALVEQQHHVHDGRGHQRVDHLSAQRHGGRACSQTHPPKQKNPNARPSTSPTAWRSAACAGDSTRNTSASGYANSRHAT